MPDLTDQLLPQVLSYRIHGLDLGGEFVYPNYHGGSTANLASSVARLLDVPGLGLEPLRLELLEPLLGNEPASKVVLILMDALSFVRFKRWLGAGDLETWSRLAESDQGVLAPLTSVTPSTTSAALTSLWTGRSPAEHGIVGYELWLKEYGVVANMIAHAPMSFRGCASLDTLACAGFKPETFVPYKSLGEQLAGHGVKSYAYQHRSIINSGLSHMFFQEVKPNSVGNAAELWINVRRQVESNPQERSFTYVYWLEVDHLSHFYGPDDERTRAEFVSFTDAFRDLFLDKLKPAARQGTVLLFTADHGQINTRPDPHYDLDNHPSLSRRLHIFPTGENRLAYLYVHPGQVEAVREYVEKTWPNQFTFLDPAYAVAQGLFGPGEPNSHLLDRLGDLLMLARNDSYLWWANTPNHLIGRHGGLSPEEMVVPFLGVRL